MFRTRFRAWAKGFDEAAKCISNGCKGSVSLPGRGEAVSRPNKEIVNGQDNRKSGAFIRR